VFNWVSIGRACDSGAGFKEASEMADAEFVRREMDQLMIEGRHALSQLRIEFWKQLQDRLLENVNYEPSGGSRRRQSLAP
jgi:hypothetical protein